MKPNDLSFDLLKSVRQFVSGYEPDTSPLWLWEEAILAGYDAFRYIKAKRRARVQTDMQCRKLVIQEFPA